MAPVDSPGATPLSGSSGEMFRGFSYTDPTLFAKVHGGLAASASSSAGGGTWSGASSHHALPVGAPTAAAAEEAATAAAAAGGAAAAVPSSAAAAAATAVPGPSASEVAASLGSAAGPLGLAVLSLSASKPMSPGSGDGVRSTNILDDFMIDNVELSRGAYSTVRKGIRKTTGEFVAIKDIDKRLSDGRREIDIMRRCGGHANVVKLLAVYEDADHCALTCVCDSCGDDDVRCCGSVLSLPRLLLLLRALLLLLLLRVLLLFLLLLCYPLLLSLLLSLLLWLLLLLRVLPLLPLLRALLLLLLLRVLVLLIRMTFAVVGVL